MNTEAIQNKYRSNAEFIQKIYGSKNFLRFDCTEKIQKLCRKNTEKVQKLYRNYPEIVPKKYRNFTENVQKENFYYTEGIQKPRRNNTE